MRKNIIRKKVSDSRWSTPFSEEQILESLEASHETSEARLSKILDSGRATEVFGKETAAFAEGYTLETLIATTKNSIPVFDDDIHFEYTAAIEDFQNWIEDCVDTVAVFIKEHDKVIGFGIAIKKDTETKIDVIEVEINSTRRAGLFKRIEIESLSFEIGVGHLIVLKLLEACQRPLWTDSTNEGSRYIFKSLGFAGANSSINPCILRKDA